MKEKISRNMQNFARGILQPVFFTALMGIIVALCSLLQYNFVPNIIRTFAGQISSSLTFIIGNMSVLFALALATHFAKRNKLEAALLAILTYLMFMSMNNAMLVAMGKLVKSDFLFGTGQKMELGTQITDMGVFLGIIIGCIVGYMHNKFSDTKLKGILEPFGGAKYTFFLLVFVTYLIALGSLYVWPLFATVVYGLTKFLGSAGGFGVFLYDFLLRFFIPTGLHHFVWTPIFYTELGGAAQIAGKVYQGSLPIILAELANVKSITFMDPSIRFLHTNISVIFGFPGIAMAIIATAKPENKAKVKKLVIPACVACVMAGLGEPILFLFIFTAPLLWITDAVLVGVFSTIAYYIGMRMYWSSLIPTVLQNLILGANLTKWPLTFIIGPIATITWFVVFRFLIIKFNLKTPGREEDMNYNANTITGNENELTSMIIQGLGGKNNIITVSNCFTRLRVDVKDETIINKDILNKTGNNGIAVNGKYIQVIYGPKARDYRTNVCAALGIED